MVQSSSGDQEHQGCIIIQERVEILSDELVSFFSRLSIDIHNLHSILINFLSDLCIAHHSCMCIIVFLFQDSQVDQPHELMGPSCLN